MLHQVCVMSWRLLELAQNTDFADEAVRILPSKTEADHRVFVHTFAKMFESETL